MCPTTGERIYLIWRYISGKAEGKKKNVYIAWFGLYSLGKQLKEAILKGSHPLLASLMERSGLIVADKSENRDSVVDVPQKEILLNPGIRDDEVQGDFLNRNLLHTNRVWNESATEIPGEPSYGNQITVVNGCDRLSNELNPVKNLKLNSVHTKQAVKLNSVLSQETERIEETSEGFVQHTRREECNFSKEPWVEGLQESRSPDGGDDDHVTSKKLRRHSNESNPAKKLKVDSLCTQPTVHLNSVSSQVTARIEDPSGGLVQHVQTEVCDLSKEPWVGLEESRLSGGVYDEHVASKKLRQSCEHSDEADHAKKLKQDSFYSKQTVNLNSASSQATELIEDPSGGFVQHIRREECNFSKERRVEDLEESRFPDGDHDEHVASKKLRRCCNHDDAMLHDQQQIPRNDQHNVPREMSGDGQSQMASVFKDGSDEIRELNSSDKSKDNIEDNIQANALDGAAAGKTKDNLDLDHELSTKKHAFLSSQCTYYEDSVETIDLTEVNVCVKCNEGGQMLVCSSDACPLVVHESCLGSAAAFDGNGNFYCPFCAYSRAISVYKEAKKKASLARKDLEAFVGFGNICRQKFSKGLSGSVQNQPREENLFEKTEANDDENNVNEVNNTRCRSYVEEMVLAEPSVLYVNDDLPSVRKGTAVTNEENCDLTGDELEGQTLLQNGQPPSELEEQQIAGPVFHGCEPNISSSIDMEIGHVTNETNCGLTGDELEGQTLLQECQPPRELEEQQIAGPLFLGCEPNTSSSIGKEIGHVANETNCSLLQDKLEGQKVGQECQSPSEQEEQQIVRPTVNDCEPNTSSFRGKKIGRGSNRHSEVQLQNTVLNQQVTDIPHETSTSIQGSSEEEDHKPAASRYSRRSHKQKPLYTYPASPSLRRKVIPWTNLEEKTLKEGVQKFSNVNDKVVPWKKILDFGGTVFQGRTAVDLKDKWRNICKGSPKPK